MKIAYIFLLLQVKRRIDQSRGSQNSQTRSHVGSAHVEFMYPKGSSSDGDEEGERSRSSSGLDNSLPANTSDSVLLTSYSRIPVSSLNLNSHFTLHSQPQISIPSKPASSLTHKALFPNSRCSSKTIHITYQHTYYRYYGFI